MQTAWPSRLSTFLPPRVPSRSLATIGVAVISRLNFPLDHGLLPHPQILRPLAPSVRQVAQHVACHPRPHPNPDLHLLEHPLPSPIVPPFLALQRRELVPASIPKLHHNYPVLPQFLKLPDSDMKLFLLPMFALGEERTNQICSHLRTPFLPAQAAKCEKQLAGGDFL